jgi:hypothetical protein
MSKRKACLERIAAIEREYAVAKLAVRRMRASLRANPSLLTAAELNKGDFEALNRNLGPTFIVRMYAEFEAGLRNVWASARRKSTQPPMRQLLDALASWKRVADEDLANAHLVREYRNALVHEERCRAAPVELAIVSQHLCKFFRYVPPTW